MDNQKTAAPRITLRLKDVLSANRPHNTLISWRGEQRLTLSKFRFRVKKLIRQLQSCPEQQWAICFNDSYLFSAALLALIYCGKTPVIPGHLRQAQLKEQYQQGAFDALLSDLPLQIGCPTIWSSATPHDREELAIELPEWPENAELILFTSGSTGQPKAVHKLIRLLEAESELLANNWRSLVPGTRIAATVSHQHLYGLTFRILLPLVLGLPFNAQLTEYHEQLQPLATTPLALIASPAYLKRLDSSLRVLNCSMVVSAGGPLNLDEARRVKQCLKVAPLEIYGTSETGVIAHRRQEHLQQPWQPFNGIQITRQPDGEINVVSPLFNNDAGSTIGDLISLEPDGFHLLGRKDKIIKIEEKRISLADVEQRLISLDEISDAAVIPITQNGRTLLAAAIVLTNIGQQRHQQGDHPLTQHLRQQLREWLEPVALPKRWRIVSAIPLNTQGKRAYSELQELFL